MLRICSLLTIAIMTSGSVVFAGDTTTLNVPGGAAQNALGINIAIQLHTGLTPDVAISRAAQSVQKEILARGSTQIDIGRPSPVRVSSPFISELLLGYSGIPVGTEIEPFPIGTDQLF